MTMGPAREAPARRTERGLDAFACLRAGIDAVEPEALVREFMAAHEVDMEGMVYLVALGKAGAPMTRGVMAALGEEAVADAVAVIPNDLVAPVPEGVRAVGAGHPRPSEGSVRGAEAILDLARKAGEGDLLFVLISGGGSALSTLPPDGVSLDDLQAATEALLRCGATIDELNCVRKHLDQLKGGRLAKIAHPARVLALVLSDVVGDRLDVIASGPVSPDPTTYADALAVVDRKNLRATLPESVVRHLERGVETGEGESPGSDDPAFERVEVHVVGHNRLAADAVLLEASRRGYAPHLLTTTLTGEAREAGRFLAATGCEVVASGRPVQAPAALLAAGETTVTVTGSGRGGRNQELALGAALELAALGALPGAGQVTVASLGTDGIDGPTNAAGAVADARTVERGREAGVDAAASLEDNHAYGFFASVDDLIVIGSTGTNVMDLVLVLVSDK